MARSLKVYQIKNPYMTTIIRFFLAALFISSALSSFAQDETERNFKPWRVDGGMGWARPSGKGSKAGVLLFMEPKYNITDQVSVGLRMEATAMARGYVDVNGNAFSGKAGLGLSFVPTVDYFFTQSTVRPFIGAGGGIYNLVTAEINTTDNQFVKLPAATRFGGVVRAGVDVWHLKAAVEYNMVGKTQGINNNYIGLKLGIVIGGGKYATDEGDY